MRIVEIAVDENGAHRNQTANLKTVPAGWAVIPDGMETPNFPFGDITVEEMDGVMVVTSWTAGTIPAPEPTPEPEPTADEDRDAMLIDLAYRVTMLELGGDGSAV